MTLPPTYIHFLCLSMAPYIPKNCHRKHPICFLPASGPDTNHRFTQPRWKWWPQGIRTTASVDSGPLWIRISWKNWVGVTLGPPPQQPIEKWRFVEGPQKPMGHAVNLHQNEGNRGVPRAMFFRPTKIWNQGSGQPMNQWSICQTFIRCLALKPNKTKLWWLKNSKKYITVITRWKHTSVSQFPHMIKR